MGTIFMPIFKKLILIIYPALEERPYIDVATKSCIFPNVIKLTVTR